MLFMKLHKSTVKIMLFKIAQGYCFRRYIKSFIITLEFFNKTSKWLLVVKNYV